jgi:hypothetical protein
MIVHKHVRALAAAFLLALVIASVPTASTHARTGPAELEMSVAQGPTEADPAPIVRDHRREPGTSTVARQKSVSQRRCEALGHRWRDGQCADKRCHDGSNGANWGDGEVRITGGQWYVCDGFSGQWVHLPRVQAPVDDPSPTTPSGPANTGNPGTVVADPPATAPSRTVRDHRQDPTVNSR